METSGIAQKMVHALVRWALLVVIICLGSSILIQHYTHLPNGSSAHKGKPVPAGPAANEAQFHALMDAGDQAFRNGDYGDALRHYFFAEHTAGRLTDEQYDQLKNARLAIAQVFDQESESTPTRKLYRAMADCALHQGDELFTGAEYDDALARGQEAEEFSSHLADDRSLVLQNSIYLSVDALKGLKRYPDAVETNQRLIDYLNSAPGDNNAALSLSYENLAGIYLDAQDWTNSEQALNQLIERSEGLLAEYSSPQQMLENAQLVNGLMVARNWAQYNLVIVYYFAGDTDTALSKAENYYNDLSSHPPVRYYRPASANQPPAQIFPLVYNAQAFASLGLRIAIDAKRQDVIDSWRKRGGVDYGTMSTISFHPPKRR